MDSYGEDAFLLGWHLVFVSKMSLFERVDTCRLAYLFNNISFSCCHESFFWNTCGQQNFCVGCTLVNMSVWVNPLARLIADCTGIRLQIAIVNFSHHISQLYINSLVLAFKRHMKYILYYNNLSWHDVTWHDMTWHDMTSWHDIQIVNTNSRDNLCFMGIIKLSLWTSTASFVLYRYIYIFLLFIHLQT